MREECSKDIRSLDAEKITDIQASSGNQYLTSERDLGTPNGTRKPPVAATLQWGGSGAVVRRASRLPHRVSRPRWNVIEQYAPMAGETPAPLPGGSGAGI
jgi:hypothetical protein